MEGLLVPYLLYSATDAEFVDWLRERLKSGISPPNRLLELSYQPDESPKQEAPSPNAKSYDVMLVVLSPASGDISELNDAVSTARLERKAVILLQLKDVQQTEALRDLPVVDFNSDWLGGLAVLHGRLEELASRPREAERPRADFLTTPPHVLPEDQFRDRTVESESLTRQLFSSSVGVMVLSGPEGIGKTAMVARILNALHNGPGSWPSWVIYLPADGFAPVSAAALLTLLSRVPSSDEAADPVPLLLDPDLTPVDKLLQLLQGLDTAHVLVVIDHVEDLLDEHDDFVDAELGELLEVLAGKTSHQHVKALLITRREPRRLMRPGNVKRFLLDDGLELPDTKEFLRAIDRDGGLGLKFADDTVLERIQLLTDGNPRALEALYSILERDPDTRPSHTRLAALLDEMDKCPSTKERTSFLVARMFEGLGHTERRVVRALAVYGRPVPAEAVDHLLEPYVRYFKSAPELRVLLRRRFIRSEGDSEGDRYYLPLTDRERVLAGIERGRPEDRESPSPPETQLALFHRAANFFAQPVNDEAKGLGDLSPHLMEIDLRIAGEEFDQALDVVHHVDLLFLRPWGYSQLLIPQRVRINGNVSDRQAELANLDALGNATQQRDDLVEAKGYLRQAVALANELDAPDDLARSYINLGEAYLADMEPSNALALFKKALETAQQHGLPTEEAYARGSMSVCYGQMGRLDEAIVQHERTLQAIDQARGMASDQAGEELAALEVEVLLSRGELLGRRGQPDQALVQLDASRRLALELDMELLVGELLSASAEIRIDQGSLTQATELASAAIELGRPRRNPQLLQSAHSMLALAALYDNDLARAKAAVVAAARYPRGKGKLEPSVLLGVVALRTGDHERAREAFRWVDFRAQLPRKRDRQNISVLDPHAIALCGLTLCGGGIRVPEAVASFRLAREASSSQGGVARRTCRLLDQMAQVDPTDRLGPARDAAAP